MSDIIMQLWERSRTSVSQETASPVPTPMSTHVASTLLMVVKLPDIPVPSRHPWLPAATDTLWGIGEGGRRVTSSYTHISPCRPNTSNSGQVPRCPSHNVLVSSRHVRLVYNVCACPSSRSIKRSVEPSLYQDTWFEIVRWTKRKVDCLGQS